MTSAMSSSEPSPSYTPYQHSMTGLRSACYTYTPANALGLAAEIELGLGLVLEAAVMHMQGIGMLVPSTHTSFLVRHRTTLFINRACVHSVARLRKSLQSDFVVCAEDTNMPTNGFSCANLTQSHATYMDTTRPICLLHSHPDCCSASSSNTRHNAPPAFTPNYPSAVLRLLRPNDAQAFPLLAVNVTHP